MLRYPTEVIEKVRRLRSLGMTYREIKDDLQISISKSTLSEWCKGVILPEIYSQRVSVLNLNSLNRARLIAQEANAIKRELFLKEIDDKNFSIASAVVDSKTTAKIALAMLCLGEASKSIRKTSFYFGNSDPKIILVFLSLMKICFQFDVRKVRCTVQCRADQVTEELEHYWQQVTDVPSELFYKTRIDPRTVGKETKNKDYKGVLRVDYFDNKVRLELESLANLIYNQLTIKGR